jgi:hypothetical protein
MAKITTPLLSFDARGKLAKTLVFSAWRGIATARQHVTPANPKTTAQTAHRAIVADMVYAWQYYFDEPVCRTAWTKAAAISGKPLSGYNAFLGAAIPAAALNPSASFGAMMLAVAGERVIIQMKNLDTGGAGSEANPFDLYEGTNPGSLLFSDDGVIFGTDLTFDCRLPIGTVTYGQVRQHWDHSIRSGIYRYTVLA